MAAEPTQRDKLVSQLRQVDDDEVGRVLQRARLEVSPHSLGFGMVDDDSPGYLRWPAVADELNDIGLTFGEVISTDQCPLRVVAYDVGTDKLWGTSESSNDKLGSIVRWSGKTYTKLDTHSPKDAVLRAVEDANDGTEYSQLVGIAEKELARMKTVSNIKGLTFRTKSKWGFVRSAFFSWENMTTELKERGYAFGDVVVDGRRVIALRDGVLWVARSAPRVDVVEKM